MGPSKRACTLWNFVTFLCLLVCIAFQFSVFVYNYRQLMTIDERLDNLERIVEWLFERGTLKEGLKPPANQNKLRERKSTPQMLSALKSFAKRESVSENRIFEWNRTLILRGRDGRDGRPGPAGSAGQPGLSDNGISDENDSDAFSSVQSPQASFAQTNGTNQKAGDSNVLLPHEQRRQRRLKRERLYLKHMTEQIKEQLNSDYTIERIHQPSKETFVERYMKTGKPVILTGMMESWDATKSWNFSQLAKDLTKGVKVDIMGDFTPYSRWNEFRRRFSDMYREPSKIVMNNFDRIYPGLLDDINFPEFSQDYMEVIDEDIRPPQLSLEMAPKRSGFHWRVEPLNASAWSALVLGSKRWGLYPPSVYYVPGVAHNNHQTQDSQQSESFTWWIYTRPHLREDYKPLECIQEPGEILYIPSGWWWSNVNIEDSITIQKSVCDEASIRACMEELKVMADSTGDNFHGDVFIQLRHYLAKHNPELLNEDDREFKSPIRGLGTPNSELGYQHHGNVWEKYFVEGSDVEEDSYRSELNA